MTVADDNRLLKDMTNDEVLDSLAKYGVPRTARIERAADGNVQTVKWVGPLLPEEPADEDDD